MLLCNLHFLKLMKSHTPNLLEHISSINSHQNQGIFGSPDHRRLFCVFNLNFAFFSPNFAFFSPILRFLVQFCVFCVILRFLRHFASFSPTPSIHKRTFVILQKGDSTKTYSRKKQ